MSKKEFLIVFILVIISLIIFNFMKKYILSKFKLKKSYIIISILIIIFIPAIFYKPLYNLSFVYYIQTIILSLLVLTYMEIRRKERIEKNRPIVGKPKPKKVKK